MTAANEHTGGPFAYCLQHHEEVDPGDECRSTISLDFTQEDVSQWESDLASRYLEVPHECSDGECPGNVNRLLLVAPETIVDRVAEEYKRLLAEKTASIKLLQEQMRNRNLQVRTLQQQLAERTRERDGFRRRHDDCGRELAEYKKRLRNTKEQLATANVAEWKDHQKLAASDKQLAECRAERDHLAKRLREVQVELGKVLGAEAALEPQPKPLAIGEHVACTQTIDALKQELAEKTARIELLEGQLDTRTQQVDACRAELLTRSESVAVAEELRVKVTLELAECRAELELIRTELGAALGEGDALKAERGKLRNVLKDAYSYVLCRGEWSPVSEDTLRKDIEAALSPTPEKSDGVTNEDGCLELLEQHHFYLIDSALGVAVSRRDSRHAWIVSVTGRRVTLAYYDLLRDAIAAAICVVEAIKKSDGAFKDDDRRPKDIATELAKTMQCNCDLDNWEPEQSTGHSRVCRIHKKAQELHARKPTKQSDGAGGEEKA